MAAQSLVRLTLTAPRTARVGAAIPIEVKLCNVSQQPVWLVGVVDGSESGFRYPQFLPDISVAGKNLPTAELAECGMVAPLRLSDIRQVAAGECFDPTVATGGAAYLPLQTFARFRPPSPGRYEFRLTFSSASSNPDEWLGVLAYPGHEAVRERLISIPQLRLTSSASVEVSVEESGN